MLDWGRNWLTRHRHPVSLILHAVGIPMLVAACVLAIVQVVGWRWDLWWRPTALIVVSYFLQWVGHAIEGNDMGEIILIKKLLGRPYVAVAPRFQTRTDQTS